MLNNYSHIRFYLCVYYTKRIGCCNVLVESWDVSGFITEDIMCVVRNSNRLVMKRVTLITFYMSRLILMFYSLLIYGFSF